MNKALKKFLSSKKAIPFSLTTQSTHAVIKLEIKNKNLVIDLINKTFPELRILSIGKKMEIYKEVGRPVDVVKRFIPF